MALLTFDQNIPVVISYSMGSSSKWLVVAVINGWLPRPKYLAVVCADTGAEHEWSYADRENTRRLCEENGIDFLDCRREEQLPAHLIGLSSQTRETKRLDHPPFWIDKGGGSYGRASHRCTREFKVAPMRRAVAKWLRDKGLPKRVVKWIGYSLDEAHRVGKSLAKQDVAWERLEFPGVLMRKTRGEMRADLVRAGIAAPRFSMCVFCPFKGDERWRDTTTADMDKAIEVDDAIRDLDEIGLTDGPAYVSSALIPLSKLVVGAPRIQPILPGLESWCDGGACFL